MTILIPFPAQQAHKEDPLAYWTPGPALPLPESRPVNRQLEALEQMYRYYSRD